MINAQVLNPESTQDLQPGRELVTVVRVKEGFLPHSVRHSILVKNKAGADKITVFVEHVWPKYDTSNRGYLNRDAAQALYRDTYPATSVEEFAKIWMLMDTNQKGLITQADLTRYFKFYCS